MHRGSIPDPSLSLWSRDTGCGVTLKHLLEGFDGLILVDVVVSSILLIGLFDVVRSTSRRLVPLNLIFSSNANVPLLPTPNVNFPPSEVRQRALARPSQCVNEPKW